MAFPLSVLSKVVDLIAVSCQATKALRETINSYENHTKSVRDLKDELSALEDTLQLLKATLLSFDDADFTALESLLRRCGCACDEFKQSLERCAGRNEDDKSSFRSWLKLRWLGNDINGFKDTLAGYKSTIAIAIAGANLQTTKVSLDVVREHKEMVQSTITDLKEHLHVIDEGLHEITLDQHHVNNESDGIAVRDERDCTIQCLEICEQAAVVIDEKMLLMDRNCLAPTLSGAHKSSAANLTAPQEIVGESLQRCGSRTQTAGAQLKNRPEFLTALIKHLSASSLEPNSIAPSDHERCTYQEDDQIPFAPDGSAPLISDGVEKVKGTSGLFEGLKCVRKTLILQNETEPIVKLHQRRTIVEEVKVLHSARHHHVIELIHVYFDTVDENQWKFAIVMDRADSNLHLYLRPGMSPPIQWFSCLIGVVHYIHSLGIRHRDIKPSNILVKGQRVILADFGISQMGLGKTMPTTYQYRNSSRTRQYCAPEVDLGATRGRSADMFSLGAVFLEMLVVLFFPDRLKDLYSVLKPSAQSISSYANRLEEVHCWIRDSLHNVGWQQDLLATCSRMLDPDRHSRPSADDVRKTWSNLSNQNISMVCDCAQSLSRTKSENLIEACRIGSEEEVKGLLDIGAEPQSLGALHFAAARGKVSMVQVLLDAGAPVDIRNAVGQSALHCASRNGHVDVVKQLLFNNAAIDAKDENDQTALHGASGHGYEYIVRILLDAGADALAEDLDGSTAAYFAMKRQHRSVQALLEGTHDESFKLSHPVTDERTDERSDDGVSIISMESSPESVFSQNGSDSSMSSVASSSDRVIDYFVALTLRDDGLSSLLAYAANRMPHDRFIRNHQRLLRDFYLNLRSGAQEEPQKEATRLLHSRRRREAISSRIYGGITVADALSSLKRRALGQKNIDLIARMLQAPPATALGVSNESIMTIPSPIVDPGAMLDHTYAETGADECTSGSDSSSEDQDEFTAGTTRFYTGSTLESVEHFMFMTQAYKTYKDNVRRFVHPRSPRLLRELVMKGEVGPIKEVLEEDFDLVARDDFNWLEDLVAADYEITEIAELLVDVDSGSPWLYFEPAVLPQYQVDPNLHQKSCRHETASHLQQREACEESIYSGLRLSNSLEVVQCDTIRRHISEQCGFAGIIPLSRAVSEWDGDVLFYQNNGSTTALLSYTSRYSGQTAHLRLHERLICIGARLRNAFGLLQHHGICCSFFTVLSWSYADNLDPVLDLRRIDAKVMLAVLDTLGEPPQGGFTQLQHLSQAAQDIINEVVMGQSHTTSHDRLSGDWEQEVLHQASLALQILSLGLLSFSYAHAGAVNPFFLQHEVQKLILLGSEPVNTKLEDSQRPRITAELANLTCMNGLVQKPVLTFRSSDPVDDSRSQGAYDLLASPADVIDTWGPALLISDTDSIHADGVLGIEIGGGLLSHSEDSTNELHWQELSRNHDLSSFLATAQPFSLHTKQRIGAIRVNDSCPLRGSGKREDVKRACNGYLHELGTSGPSWRLKTAQIGSQMGQYALLTAGLEFERLEGLTIKGKMIRGLKSVHPHIHLSELEAHYGLEISLCTGVARRIPLRLLLADVLPAYMQSTVPNPPGWDQFGSDLTDALKSPDLSVWYRALREDIQMAVIRTLGDVIIHLSDTGLDNDGNLNVAWVRPGQVQRCFKLHGDKLNLWTRILEDTDHCATFACITTTCLEADVLRCQGANRNHWRNVSEFLTTEVCRHGLVTANFSQTAQLQKPFTLRNNGKYWIGPTNSGLLAYAILTDSPTLEISHN